MHNLRQKRAGCPLRGQKEQKYQTQAQWTVDFHAESLFVHGQGTGGLARGGYEALGEMADWQSEQW
ncbi:MAG: hypothetical protein WAW39_05245 [Prosthecobacter sp.]|uniref:hypothetical protein n=1 Tax=Prosthecobacter sp. TaxID=1965333 RepID=UPI003BB1DBDD